MLTLYLLFGILYAALLVWLYSLWSKKTIPNSPKAAFPKVSLLIPVRNESQNLKIIFDSISCLDPAPDEVIWIDDNSEDASVDILKEKIEKYAGPSQMMVITNSGLGKKDAIGTAISRSSGEWIVTSDADCNLPKNWLSEMLPLFNSSKIQFFSGPVFIHSAKGFFNAFQQLDWASIALLSNAGVASGNPLMASAANMAYRKNAFQSINGYESNDSLLSGDDEFLLKAIVKAYGLESIAYNKATFVKTNAHQTWQELFEQRARWISKWKSHDSLSHALTSFLSFLVQLIFLSSLILLCLGKVGAAIVAAIWLLKIIIEYVILNKILKYFRLNVRFLFYPLASIFYPFYVVLCIFKMAKGGVSWKGRKIKKNYL